MPLPEIALDNLRFQKDLVDEARKRIIRYCPEWTDYNLSDPGITLIELFAWMTELITFRLNKVPEKNYRKFLDLLDIKLLPASNARTELTFFLSAPFPLRPDHPEDNNHVLIPAGKEFATEEMPDEPAVIFVTEQDFQVNSPRCTQIRTPRDWGTNYTEWWIEDADFPFYVFGTVDNCAQGEAFYIGFDADYNLAGHILQLEFLTQAIQGTGIEPDDPPLVWECAVGGDQWQPIVRDKNNGRLSKNLPLPFLNEDTTRGFIEPVGTITFHLPLDMQATNVAGIHAYWLRCRHSVTNSGPNKQYPYNRSPVLEKINAKVLGAYTMAAQKVCVSNEELGNSSGDPGQIFQLAHFPLQALQNNSSDKKPKRTLDFVEDWDATEGETLWVEEERDGVLGWACWQCVENFAASSAHDYHFTLETSTGEVRFGPSIRQPDGTMRQYGRVPGIGKRIRIREYYYNEGARGNVPANRIQVMRSAIPYIDRVTNRTRAEGGSDQETIDEAMMRARRQLRTQNRAVTAEDFETLALEFSTAIARAKCLTPLAPGKATSARTSLAPGSLRLLVIPSAKPWSLQSDLPLRLPSDLRRRLSSYFDDHRLLTSTLDIAEPNYVGVKVEAHVVRHASVSAADLQQTIRDLLNAYLTPLGGNALGNTLGSTLQEQISGLVEDQWRGWDFGAPLVVEDLFALLQRVRGVKFVRDVKVHSCTIKMGVPLLEHIPDQTTTIKEGELLLQRDQCLCSLNHEIRVDDLLAGN